MYMPMSSNSNGSSSPCKSKVKNEVVSSRPTRFMCNYQLKKKKLHVYAHKIFLIFFFSEEESIKNIDPFLTALSYFFL